MYLHKVPAFFRYIYPHYLWKMPTSEKVLYLTFDDGPTQEITEWVLDQLAAYDAAATFFMIGNNVRKHPEIAHAVIDAGHVIGNHTQNHANGWKTDGKIYLKEVLEAQQTFGEYTGYTPSLFRPPYGRVTTSQARSVRSRMEVVMMDIVSGDFDLQLSGAACAQKVIDLASPGSIIVFHDSQKAWDRLSIALPRVLKHFAGLGFQFRALTPQQESVPTLPVFFM